MENQVLDRIMELLNDESDETKLNTIQLISNVGEHPEAREYFKRCLDKLEFLTKSVESPLVSRFAQTAIDVITWVP
jgi:hypothetical protein